MQETKIKTKEELEKELEDKFNQSVVNFKLRWLNKGTEISRAGIYNYAMSVMRYEFHNKFSKEKSQKLVDVYKP